MPSVFGRTTQDKDTELFVEEIYYNSLDDLNDADKVEGLNTTFNTIAVPVIHIIWMIIKNNGNQQLPLMYYQN